LHDNLGVGHNGRNIHWEAKMASYWSVGVTHIKPAQSTYLCIKWHSKCFQSLGGAAYNNDTTVGGDLQLDVSVSIDVSACR
jgi:hypothetical protein